MSDAKFITIEGIEGVGKSTAVKYIQDYLAKKGKHFLVTREPGGTPVAEELRKILLAPHWQEGITQQTELLLMFAARSQHVANVIIPALEREEWVVSDRFVDASFAYQGGGRGMDLTEIDMLERWVLNGLLPDLTLLLDAPVDIGLVRAKHRSPEDRIEQEKKDFFERVRKVYLERAEKNKQRFRIIDASQPLHVVQETLKTMLDEFIA